jgi:hypothetical protein
VSHELTLLAALKRTHVRTHRELQDEKQRLHFLKFTLMAQVKLAEEITPKELEHHGGSPDPVAAALSARRAALQAVRDSYSSLLKHHMHTGAGPRSRQLLPKISTGAAHPR